MDVAGIPGSAQVAFENNSIQAVRSLEKQLNASISRDKERLRTLVGGNYRDLLATAEEIVALDRKSQNAESQISGLSRLCKPPQPHNISRPIPNISSTSAQLRLLTQCITYGSTALQSRSVLLCAELTVVSRLLLKSLTEQPSPPKSLEAIRAKAITLRRRLLRLVDSQLAHPASSIDTLVFAICAYCLVNSASSGDAVKHFGHIRAKKLRHRVTIANRSQTQLKEDFQYLITSVQLLKSLLGRAVNDALGLLQKQPILQHKLVRKLEALDSDRLHNLVPADILGFTPYIKRVLLKQDEVQDVISEWVREACQVFMQGCGPVLDDIKAVGDVLLLRKELLSTLLPAYFSTYASNILLDTVRQSTTDRILGICRTQTDTLVETSQAMVAAESETSSDVTLWHSSLVQTLMNSNSSSYVRQVRSCHLGIKGEMSRNIRKIKHWARQVAQLQEQFQIVETTRWKDLLEEHDDDEEEAAESVISQLAKDDPMEFRNAMNISINRAISQFKTTLQDATNEVTSMNATDSHNEQCDRVVHLIRALRESSRILAASVPGLDLDTTHLVPKLHDSLAGRVSDKITRFVESSEMLSTSASSLPDDLPSPQAFAFLRDVCKAMQDVGSTDIWSRAAVDNLKTKLTTKLLESEGRPPFVQNDFDECFIRAALRNERPATNVTDSGDVKGKADAYWQRTKLLFGLLSYS